MPTYAEALDTILANVKTLDAEDRALARALGQVLAEDVCSEHDLPLRDTAAFDGYAVRSADIQQASGNSPVTLQVVGTLRAGYLSRIPVLPGAAIRTMTGSVVPEGADSVVKFEDTDEPADKSGPNPGSPTRVRIYVRQPPGANINRAGSSIRRGSLLAARHTLIGPPQIAALAAVGRTSVKAIRRPRVAVITTGDELIRAGAPLSPGKAYNSNEVAIRSLVLHYGGSPWVLGIARDKESALASKMRQGLAADAIITSGGVSRGDYDLVRLVIGKVGRVVFHRVEMRPGASFAFGLANSTAEGAVPIFALSGPPWASMVNFETLVRPALLKMRGLSELRHPVVEAVIEKPAANRAPVDHIAWTDLRQSGGEHRVRQLDSGGLLADMAGANSLTILPAGTQVKAGERIQVLPLDWC